MITHLVSPLRDRVKDRHVLIIGDSTEICLDDQIGKIRDAERIGVLSDNQTRGFHLHLSMCIDAQSSEGLGLSDMLLWNRQISHATKAEKEQARRSRSWCWRRSWRASPATGTT